MWLSLHISPDLACLVLITILIRPRNDARHHFNELGRTDSLLHLLHLPAPLIQLLLRPRHRLRRLVFLSLHIAVILLNIRLLASLRRPAINLRRLLSPREPFGAVAIRVEHVLF